jgi:hypothetical protein
MKTKIILATVLSLVIIVIATAGASIFLNSQKQTPPNTPTPPPTPVASVTETPSPTAIAPPQENLVFKQVSIGANNEFTIQVSCSSPQDITLVQAIIKDAHGNTIKTDNFNITIPASGEMPLQLTTPVSIQSEPLSVILVTKNNNSFTSPEIHFPTRTFYSLNTDN